MTDNKQYLENPKLIAIAKDLGVKPFWLWLPIQSESAWKPTAINPLTQSVGLIQFMPQTLAHLGVSHARALQMGVDGQLDLVHQYFKPAKGKLKTFYDPYIYMFYPAALGKPDKYVIGSERGANYAALVAKQNPIFDLNKDGKVTLGEFKRWYAAKARKHGYTGLKDLFFTISKNLTR